MHTQDSFTCDIVFPSVVTAQQSPGFPIILHGATYMTRDIQARGTYQG